MKCIYRKQNNCPVVLYLVVAVCFLCDYKGSCAMLLYIGSRKFSKWPILGFTLSVISDRILTGTITAI